jgi:ribosomal protein S18 acetylase RimI-like enzyme
MVQARPTGGTMKDGISIRNALPEQSGEASALIVGVIEALDIYSVAARKDEVQKYSPDKLALRIADDPHSVRLAFADQTMAGFLITEFQSGPIWIHWYGVHASARGLGVGEAMLTHLITTAPQRGATRIWCDTRTNNLPSIALLKRLHFHQLCELRNHWHNQDYFLWSRDLCPACC